MVELTARELEALVCPLVALDVKEFNDVLELKDAEEDWEDTLLLNLFVDEVEDKVEEMES